MYISNLKVERAVTRYDTDDYGNRVQTQELWEVPFDSLVKTKGTRRFFAKLIDFYFLLFVLSYFDEYLDEEPSFFIFLWIVLLNVFYCTLSEYFFKRTIGKAIMGLWVIDDALNHKRFFPYLKKNVLTIFTLNFFEPNETEYSIPLKYFYLRINNQNSKLYMLNKEEYRLLRSEIDKNQ